MWLEDCTIPSTSLCMQYQGNIYLGFSHNEAFASELMEILKKYQIYLTVSKGRDLGFSSSIMQLNILACYSYHYANEIFLQDHKNILKHLLQKSIFVHNYFRFLINLLTRSSQTLHNHHQNQKLHNCQHNIKVPCYISNLIGLYTNYLYMMKEVCNSKSYEKKIKDQ